MPSLIKWPRLALRHGIDTRIQAAQMNDKSNEKTATIAKWALLAIVCAYGFIYRLFPEYTSPNLAPIGGLALFGGYLLSSRWGWLPALAVMASSDWVLWQWKGYQPFNAPVYALFVLYALAGATLRGRLSPGSWLGRVFASSLAFFAVTNALVFATSSFSPQEHPGVWVMEIATEQYAHPLIQYARSLPGLATCYLYALPFFARTLAGDLMFSGLFLGLSLVIDRFRLRHAIARPSSSSF